MKTRVSLAILLAALVALPAIAQYQSSGMENSSAQEIVSPVHLLGNWTLHYDWSCSAVTEPLRLPSTPAAHSLRRRTPGTGHNMMARSFGGLTGGKQSMEARRSTTPWSASVRHSPV